MNKDILVVIRTSGERTFPLTYESISNQVRSTNIIVINKAPFYQAVVEMFKLAKSKRHTYLLSLDADVILDPMAVSKIISNTKKYDAMKTFRIYHNVQDKFFGNMACGNNLFFNRWSGDCYNYLLKDGDSSLNRPESVNVDNFARRFKLESHNVNETIGQHQYHQYYSHIYNSIRNRIIKSNPNNKQVMLRKITQAKAREPKDNDYHIAWEAANAGLKTEKMILDFNKYTDISNILEQYKITEKEIITNNEMHSI
jgi:hypothetical protein